MIGLENSHLFRNQSEMKSKTNCGWLAHICMLRAGFMYTLNFDWFTGLPVFFVTGHCDTFGVGFTTLK